jgi:ligand-binding sensor domain-containing protein
MMTSWLRLCSLFRLVVAEVAFVPFLVSLPATVLTSLPAEAGPPARHSTVERSRIAPALASTHLRVIGAAAGTRAATSVQENGGDAAPRLRFSRLSVADGLSHSDVRAIVQDSQGFMWFGTWLGGLNRYDGYSFKAYKHDPRNSRSLGGDSVRALYIDHEGILWAGLTGGGLDRYDRETDSFVHYGHRKGDPTSLPSDNVNAMFEDETGTLWVATLLGGGLSRLDRASGRFTTYAIDPNVLDVRLDTTTGLLWVGTLGSGVFVFDRATGRSTRYVNDPKDPASLSSNIILDLFQDRAHSLWISTDSGLNRFDPRTHTFTRYLHAPGNPDSLSDNSVGKTYEDRTGRFWVLTGNNGLNLMDRTRGTFAHYRNDPYNPASLSSDVLNSHAFCEDSSGGLWIGTRADGVNWAAGTPEKFTTYRHNPQDSNSVGGDAIAGLFVGAAGELWIGTESSLDRLDGRTFTHYVNNPRDAASLNNGGERVVAQDAHGAVWTGTFGGGLARLDPQGFTHFNHDPKNPDSPASDNIKSIVPDPRGGVWIGVSGQGIDYFDGARFTHFPANPHDPAGLTDPFAQPLLLDRNGSLWIATVTMGIVRLNTRTNRFTTYLLEPKNPGSQSVNWANDLYLDGTAIWVASSTGLFRLDPATGTFTHHYTEKDGLASNSVVGVLPDAKGNIWASTVKGLSRLDPATGKFRTYDRLDGLQSDEFTLTSRARTPDGRLFFGGPKGLNAFYPEKLADNPTPPPVVIIDFELFNKPVEISGSGTPLQQSINVTRSITLRHDQSVFRFKFAALNYATSQKNQYAYTMEGFDKDWQYTDATRRFATYTNLDPGSYTFRVKASNNDGLWNERGTS